MAGCNTERWTLDELSSALQNSHKDNKRIVVPMFQRGLRWNDDQKKTFIDSLEKGYPVGTMLFYEQVDSSGKTYILVDGLQRSNCIRGYINNPSEYLTVSSISDDYCQRILEVIGKKKEDSDFINIRKIVLDFIKTQKTYKNIQYYGAALGIAEHFDCGHDYIGSLIKVFEEFFQDLQDRYDTIANTVIPVIVYTGDPKNLPDIFDRINSKGTPLDQYEVFAASWPVDKKFKIENGEIIEHVVSKYESFKKDGYIIHGYSKEAIRNDHMVNAFEYLFGLSKYLANKYSPLGFHLNKQVDEVNPLAFELINACLNDSNKIATLYNQIYCLDVNLFEKRLEDTIEFVLSTVRPIESFKSNQHNGKSKIFHSKFQIMSMISTSFKEMYPNGDYSKTADDWNEKKKILQTNLLQYYIYDILMDWWSEGGTGKIYTVAKPNRYLNEISAQSWAITLNTFFEKTLQRVESGKVAPPRSEDYVLLNAIYMDVFTAKDQLSLSKFDIEHIAPKKQMQNLIETCNVLNSGLPISSIANLCYLPEAANRSKGAKNFYQDKKYLKSENLEEIEKKYSFTSREDLDWMDMPYSGPDDYSFLKEEYIKFLRGRFNVMKEMFCKSLGINNVDVELPDSLPTFNKEQTILTPETLISRKDMPSPFLKRFIETTGKEIVRIKGNTLRSSDGKDGYFISVSKDYHQGDRSKYWFGYRKNSLLDDFENIYYLFGCETPDNLIMMPLNVLESYLDNLNISTNEDGEIDHWHVVIFKDVNGKMTMLLSKPELQEIDISQFLLK